MNILEDPSYKNLKDDIIFLINKIKDYLDNYKFDYEIKYEEFRDYFDETWRVAKIVLIIKDVQEYIERYLYNRIREIARTTLDEHKRKKIVIIINAS